MVQKKWVCENGEGHWEVSLESRTISCDPEELQETINELLSEEESVR